MRIVAIITPREPPEVTVAEVPCLCLKGFAGAEIMAGGAAPRGSREAPRSEGMEEVECTHEKA